MFPQVKTKILGCVLGGTLTYLSFGVSAWAQTAQEERLHELYLNYYSKPTDQQAWKDMTSPLRSETYKIQPGDNLWMISEIFFGDGNYWPKVWAVNSRIENPHLIEPGNEIQFKMGGVNSEPSFLISEQNSLVAVDENLPMGTREKTELNEETDIKSDRGFRPVLQNVPPSFPTWQSSVYQPADDFNNWGVEIVPRKQVKPKQVAMIQSLILDAPVNFEGEVIETLKNAELMLRGKSIIVRFKANAMPSAGKHYIIVNPQGNVYEQRGDRSVKGQVLRMAAQISLTEEVTPDQSSPGYIYFRAVVDQTVGLPLNGLKLLPGRLEGIDFMKAGRVSDVPVRIIGGHSDSNSFLYGTGNLVFLNRGQVDGVEKGDIFVIQEVKQKEWRSPKPLVKYTQSPVGQVQVVDVRGSFATAVVLGGSQELRTGDQSLGSDRF